MVRVALGVDQGAGGPSLDLAARPLPVLVRVELEDDLPFTGDLDNRPDERAPVVALEGLPGVGGGGENVAVMGKVVAKVRGAVVEVRDAGHLELPPGNPALEEEASVPLGGDAEPVVRVRETVRRRGADPPGELQLPGEEGPEVVGVGHPFLNEHQRLPPDVPLHDEVGAGDDEVVRAGRSPVVDREMVFGKIALGGSAETARDDRAVEEAQRLQRREETVHVERRVEAGVAGAQPLADPMHHRRLVERSADQQDVLPSHSRRSSWAEMLGESVAGAVKRV